ncbi:Hypothetical predicted protein [Podarcis lilfordi]|uniref:Vipericidin n=1 Tax=Podarcis lilfordi TaxID=74358 RepID=A0AA35L4Y3_9SAUR|nr:Hypothetical predicted protein [Podarcis lilfordi]
MELLLVGAILGALGVSTATLPGSESPPALLPRNIARMAVEEYNQESGGQAVFRLWKIRSTRKTRFDWGFHFSMDFTIKETLCQKTGKYRIGDCKYKPNGTTRDCSAEVSVHNFMQDSPLTSVNCHPLQANNPNSRNARPQAMEAAQPRIFVEQYFPSSFSTAALTAPEEE